MNLKRFLLLLLGLFVVNQAEAQVLRVSKSDTTGFTRIQDAVDQADSGTVIEVQPGTYREQIVLKPGINLKGIQFPAIQSPNAGAVVKMASHAYLQGFRIQAPGETADGASCGVIARKVSGCIIFNNTISGHTLCGVLLEQTDCQLLYNFFIGNKRTGIQVQNGVRTHIGYNLFMGNAQAAIHMFAANKGGLIYKNNFIENTRGITGEAPMQPGAGLHIQNNIFYGQEITLSLPEEVMQYVTLNCFFRNKSLTGSGANTLPAGSNIFQDPLFEDSGQGDFNLRSGSPCIDAGVNGTDIGMFDYRSGNEPDASRMASWPEIRAKYEITLEGAAVNFYGDSVKGRFRGLLYSEDGLHFSCLGQYDNLNLYGNIEMSGKLKKTQTGCFRVVFDQGTAFLGRDNSRFPWELTLTYHGTVTLCDDKATGTYRMGPAPLFIPDDQAGSLEFEVVDPNFAAKRLMRKHN